MGVGDFQNLPNKFMSNPRFLINFLWPNSKMRIFFMTPYNIVCNIHYDNKLLNMRYLGLCKVLCPKEGFYIIKNMYKRITAWLIDYRCGEFKNKVSL